MYRGEIGMGNLRDFDMTTVVKELMRRGFTREQIDRTMDNLIGRDWKDLRVTALHRKLQSEGMIRESDGDLFIDDLEALISGRIKLDEINRRRLPDDGSSH